MAQKSGTFKTELDLPHQYILDRGHIMRPFVNRSEERVIQEHLCSWN